MLSTLLTVGPSHSQVPESIPEQRALELFDQGERALASGELELGESLLRQGILEAWLVRAAIFSNHGEHTQAALAYERAGRIASEERRPLLGSALVAFELGDVEDAILTLRRVLERDPDDRTVKRWIAHGLAAQGYEEEAVQELRELLGASEVADGDGPPSRATREVMFTLATGLMRIGRVDEGVDMLERMIAMDPRPEAMVLVGRTFRDFGQLDQARATLERALELDPSVPRGNFYLGSVALLIDGPDSIETALDAYRAELATAPESPWLNFHLGIVLMESRRYEEAAEALRLAVADPEPNAAAHHGLGTVLVRLGRMEEATGILERALELATAAGAEPNQISSIHYQLGLAHRALGNREAAANSFEIARASSQSEVESARAQLTRYLGTEDPDRDPTQPTEALVLGMMQAPRLPETDASRLAALASRIDQRMAGSYYNLGLLLLQQPTPQRAAPLFEEAVALQASSRHLYALAVSKFQAQDYRGAVPSLEQTLRLANESMQRGDKLDFDPLSVRRMLAVSQLHAGSPDLAADLLLTDPSTANDPALQYTLGTALIQSGRRDQARQLLDRLVAQHDSWAPLQVLLGQALAQSGNFEEARQQLRKALELDEQVQDAHAGLGMIALREGRLEDAQSHYEAELALRPDSIETQFLLANVLERQPNLERAATVLGGLLRRAPEHPGARYLLGKIQVTRGDLVDAEQQLRAAVRLAPTDANAHYQLGLCLQRLGRREEARSSFDTYRQLKDRTTSTDTEGGS